jgi:hypothetical protein
MFEVPGRQIQSLIFENGPDGSTVVGNEKVLSKSYDARLGPKLDHQQIGWSLNREMGPVSRLEGAGARAGSPHSKPHSGNNHHLIHITCVACMHAFQVASVLCQMIFLGISNEDVLDLNHPPDLNVSRKESHYPRSEK